MRLRRLEVGPWSLDLVAYVVAVLLRRESGCGPLTGINPKTRALDVLVIDDRLAVAGRDVVAARVVRNFDDFPEELVRLLLARARVLVAKVVRCAWRLRSFDHLVGTGEQCRRHGNSKRFRGSQVNHHNRASRPSRPDRSTLECPRFSPLSDQEPDSSGEDTDDDVDTSTAATECNPLYFRTCRITMAAIREE